MHSVELLLDPELDDAVRAQWRALAGAGLSSQADHDGPSNAPHVTLAVRRAIGRDLDAALAAARRAALPLPVELGGLLLFPGRRSVVVARAVVPSAGLLALHAEVREIVHDQVPDVSEERDALRHTQPGAWTPHVTLARRMPPDDLPAALTALAAGTAGAAAGPSAQVGELSALRRWDPDARRTWSL